jgi:hypothetical protein
LLLQPGGGYRPHPRLAAALRRAAAIETLWLQYQQNDLDMVR